ncbi:hypothetical protein ACIRPX_20955 [Streptomyces sp. NPDC101225]|uniref:hypothetical protein n=1 Tax=Streptomyces sp. NPDC101225 TaxID=3366135 RepID=UPI00381943AA
MRRAPAVAAFAAVLLTACSTNPKPAPDAPDPGTLRILASSELADMAPVLDQVRRDTGLTAWPDRTGPSSWPGSTARAR